MPLSSRAQLTIEGVKSTIGFDGVIGQSLRGMCDAWYGMALQAGMTQEQAATLALDSLGSTLLRMAHWNMDDTPEMIRIDGGGGKEYVPEIIGPFSGNTTTNNHAIGRSDLADCITCIDTLKKELYYPNNDDKSVKFGDFQSTLGAPEYLNSLSIGRNYYTSVAQKKDTVEVDVLCKFPKPTNVFYSTANYSNTYITQMQQERTLEYTWVGVYTPNPATNGIAGSRQWVVKSTRWLHDMEGCYHLVKITDGSPSSN